MSVGRPSPEQTGQRPAMPAEGFCSLFMADYLDSRAMLDDLFFDSSLGEPDGKVVQGHILSDCDRNRSEYGSL